MILVTGGTGFIGRRLLRRLVETYGNSDILCLVYDQAENELERSGRALLDELGVRYLSVDLATGKGLEQLQVSPDIIFHLASNTDTGAHDHSINDVGAKNLLTALAPLKKTCRVIFTSTISVSDHRQFPDQPGDESSVLLTPYSEYGRKKLRTEEYFKTRARADGFSLTFLRVSAVYGEGTRAGGLYDSLVKLAQRDSFLARLNYPGRMTMMHVDDIADTLVRLSALPPQPGEAATYLAHAETLSIHEMCAALYASLGIPFRPIKLPRWFWWCTQRVSALIYLLEPLLPHTLYNKLWQLTLLANNGYNNVSDKLQKTFPDKKFKRFADHAGDLTKRSTTDASETSKGLFNEFGAFFKRNGLRTILVHLIELYGGWLLRSLPGPEGIWLRGLFYRSLFRGDGRSLLIYPGCYIIFSSRIAVGKRVAINVGTYLDGRGEIVIGDNVMIGPHCILASCEHGFARTDVPMCEQPITYAKITLEDDVWLGGHVCVKSGITIGRGSIVGAGSVVTHDVPPFSIVGGVPAKLIRERKTMSSQQR